MSTSTSPYPSSTVRDARFQERNGRGSRSGTRFSTYPWVQMHDNEGRTKRERGKQGAEQTADDRGEGEDPVAAGLRAGGSSGPDRHPAALDRTGERTGHGRRHRPDIGRRSSSPHWMASGHTSSQTRSRRFDVLISDRAAGRAGQVAGTRHPPSPEQPGASPFLPLGSNARDCPLPGRRSRGATPAGFTRDPAPTSSISRAVPSTLRAPPTALDRAKRSAPRGPPSPRRAGSWLCRLPMLRGA